jgi:hypothetical protein
VSVYVINAAALAYMEERNLPQIVIGKFKDYWLRVFLIERICLLGSGDTGFLSLFAAV